MLLAAGVAGECDAGGAELEVLSPHGAVLYFVPLDDGILVATAQRIVAEIGHAMARDVRFDPRPPDACQFGNAFGRCLLPEVPGTTPEFDHDEFATPDPF